MTGTLKEIADLVEETLLVDFPGIEHIGRPGAAAVEVARERGGLFARRRAAARRMLMRD